MPRIDVIIPVLDERDALPLVLAELPRDLVREVVVVDNGSRDGSGEVARALGARVVHEPVRGYGRACRAGIAALAARQPAPDIVVFLDGDHSDHPQELPLLVGPLLEGRADLVVGSRVLGRRERLALLPQARFGNWLATRLLRWRHGLVATDLGPFRAIRWPALVRLDLQDPDYGFTIEMQVAAARAGLRHLEVPVSYRRRIGRSKISGTLRGSVRAGWKILRTVLARPMSSPACRAPSAARAPRSGALPRGS